jgi:hypothetical protein
MKKIVMALILTGIVTPILAQSLPWGAVSDGRRNYGLTLDKPECPKLEFAGGSQSDLTDVAADPKSALNAMPAITAQLNDAIAKLEEELKDMQADDPSRPMLEAQLKQMRDVVAKAPPAPAAPKAINLEQTLAKLRADLARGLGSGSLAALEKSAEGLSAGAASRGAYMALWHGKPQASLGLLLRAAKLEPKNAAHLVNLTALALYYGLNREALVLITAAEKLGGKLEPGVLLANKGHALLRATRYAEAEKVLRASINANPNLTEPRMNLAIAIAMQGKTRCAEALEWEARAWWRSDFSDALKNNTRPLEQKFLTQDGATPATVPMVQASYNGKPVDSNFYLGLVAPAYKNLRKRLEEIKKIPLVAELRDQWISHTLVDILDTADMGIANNSLISIADQQKIKQLERDYRAPNEPINENACQAASQNLEQRDQMFRAAYQTSYRAAFAAASRLNDKTYRYWAQLQLIYVVDSFAKELKRLRDTAEYDLGNCATKANLEPIIAGEMPATPKICEPKTASAAPKQGFAISISCDQITLNFNPPAWIPRFQVLKKSLSPLEDSQYDLRLTAFSSGGFAMVDDKGVLKDVGGTIPTPGKDWRYTFDSSKAAPVWFVAMERGAGR